MVLLRLLHRLSRIYSWKLAVAHLNHSLRGRSSDRDERFVRRAASSLKLPCICARADVRAHAKRERISTEMAARDLRHQFLARTARQFRTTSVALAHHTDDQVELFFLRLFRGTGGEGIAGMKWHNRSSADDRIRLVRPLMDITKAELEDFARKNKIRFRHDASNATLDIRRNRVRHELLPLLKARYQPALTTTILRAMDIVGAETEFVNGEAEQWLKQKPRASFQRVPLALQRRCLQLQLQRLGLITDFELIEKLRTSSGRRISVAPLLSVSRNRNGLLQTHGQPEARFKLDQFRVRIGADSGQTKFGGLHFRWRIELQKRGQLPTKPARGCERFDARKIGSDIVLRHWRAGDRFRPIGMSAPVKLQDWFTNQKIPRARRHELVLAATANGEIFWVEGQRISEQFKVTSQTRHQLVWNWKKPR